MRRAQLLPSTLLVAPLAHPTAHVLLPPADSPTSPPQLRVNSRLRSRAAHAAHCLNTPSIQFASPDLLSVPHRSCASLVAAPDSHSRSPTFPPSLVDPCFISLPCLFPIIKRYFSLSVLAASLLVPTSLATPHELRAAAANGNDPGLGNGAGIPDVSNAKNPLCVPWEIGDAARASVRLAFHDAGTYSKALNAGGAEGSILWDPTEVDRSENKGLQSIVSLLRPLPARFGVSPGDVLHLAGVLGVLACPGGPLMKAYIGRPFPRSIAPDGLLPSADDSVPKLISRFADMGFTVRDLVALIGAHSTGKQCFVKPAAANSSFDSTVDIWDVRFYAETALPVTSQGVVKLNSDVNLARSKSSALELLRYINSQDDWEEDYRVAHEKMSLPGQDVTKLTDCSEVVPASINLKRLTLLTRVDPTKLEAAIQKYRAPWL
ncbi:heme peroxidase [Mycena vulgaris]|nr:heme peroxidase [Mycena vulgaris]